ncbi:MAG: poly-gamma-glutamate synthase PgsB [Planctomycetota bacterium]
MGAFFFFALAACAAGGLILTWGAETYFHNRRMRSKRLRIHVNGIRGKSTVTRILAGMLRHTGSATIAKTTGSAACLIDQKGRDHSIHRNGAPTILEQVGIVRGLEDGIEALVIECMAIKPEYQRICEDKIIQSNIGVITNVREDHQDVLGETLEEIATSLLSTCPWQGVLITTETDPSLLAIFRRIASQRNTRLIVADPGQVSDRQLRQFSYVAFKENVAIGFALADLLGIDPATALDGMVAAAPDPGVLTISRKTHMAHRITWADLFAVNDRESVIHCVERVEGIVPEGAIKIGLLNNRSDREHRALQFARIAAEDLELDFVALLGAYEGRVETELIKHGFPAERIIPIGAHRGIEGESLVNLLISQTDSNELLILGLVNIHTDQAESLRNWFKDGQGVANESR